MTDRLPTAYNGCRCVCHRRPGVKHFMACCGPHSPIERVKNASDRIPTPKDPHPCE